MRITVHREGVVELPRGWWLMFACSSDLCYVRSDRPSLPYIYICMYIVHTYICNIQQREPLIMQIPCCPAGERELRHTVHELTPHENTNFCSRIRKIQKISTKKTTNFENFISLGGSPYMISMWEKKKTFENLWCKCNQCYESTFPN